MTILYNILYFLGVGGIVSGAVILVITRWLGKREKQQTEEQAARKAESQVTLKMLLTVGDLSRTCGIALHNEMRINGEMEKAIDAYDNAREDVRDYLVRKNADNQ